MKRITKRKLFIVIVCLIVFLPVFANGMGKNESIVGVWVERETDPVYLEISDNGNYIKYQESIGKTMPLDEGKWSIEYTKLVFRTTIGLDGEVSDIGLSMPYDIIKSSDITFLRIGSGANINFEGIKQETEATPNEK